MLLDARALEPDASLHADVCIVGAGAAGITLALALRDAGLSVYLLESGGFEITDRNQALYKGTMSGIDSFELDRARSRVFGGTTARWGGWCRPLTPDDFDVHPHIPDSGWPFSYADLVPYYERAHETVELGEFEYDPATLAARSNKLLLPFDPSVIESRVFRFSKPTRFGERYRSDLSDATDVRVYLNANLQRIRLSQPGGSVSHLECATLDGGRFTVEAQHYVLALGGIENARMLLASNTEQAEGIANGSGRVGLFMEHPHYYVTGAILWRDAPDLGFYQRFAIDSVVNGEPDTVDIVGALALSQPVRASEKLLNLAMTLTVVPADEDKLGPIAGTTAASVFGRKKADPSVVRVTFRCEQTLSDEGRLTLTSDLDELGIPRPDLRWIVPKSDEQSTRRSFEILAHELGRLGLGRYWDMRLVGDSAWKPAGAHHHMGTTRMSVDPSKGVVDANGRAHEVSNLYLAGCSVFPSGGDANPTLTIVALAHRLADHLRGMGKS